MRDYHSYSWIKLKEGVSDPGKARRKATLNDENSLRFVNVEDWHAINGAVFFVERVGVDNIVCAQNDTEVCALEFAVDLAHFKELFIGNIGFCEEHIHVSWHASGNRVNGILDADSAGFQEFSKLMDCVLCLGNGHSVARYNNHAGSHL